MRRFQLSSKIPQEPAPCGDAQADSFRQQISCRNTTDYKSNSISQLSVTLSIQSRAEQVDLFAQIYCSHFHRCALKINLLDGKSDLIVEKLPVDDLKVQTDCDNCRVISMPYKWFPQGFMCSHVGDHGTFIACLRVGSVKSNWVKLHKL